mgnify:CR=1 FL=1
MIVEGNSVAECWLSLLKIMVDNKVNEISPVVVNIKVTNDAPVYMYDLEEDLNAFLANIGQPCIETTASTIFPESLSHGKRSGFDRFDRVWKYVKYDTKNRNGHYFRRLTSYGEKYGRKINQLEHIIDAYNGIPGERKPTHRRSALIATTFDPTLDHSAQRQRGFPCLQQVCFVPNKKSELSLNAIYAMQYLSDRAYGNYVGLIRLGVYMAREMGLEMVELNCIVSVLGLGKMKKSLASDIVRKYC